MVSAIQAAISSSAGLIVCQHSCRVSFLRASHFMSDAYAWFGAAYFMYDIWWMFKVYGQKLKDQGHLNGVDGRGKLEETHSDQQLSEPNDNYLKKPIKISFFKFCKSHPVMLVHHTFLASFGLVVIVVSYLGDLMNSSKKSRVSAGQVAFVECTLIWYNLVINRWHRFSNPQLDAHR